MSKPTWFSQLWSKRKRRNSRTAPTSRTPAPTQLSLLPPNQTAVRHPVPQIRFWYRGKRVELHLTQELGTPVYWGSCPKCQTMMVLDPERHQIRPWTSGVRIDPSLVCPAECGWHVLVRDGDAVDCDYQPHR